MQFFLGGGGDHVAAQSDSLDLMPKGEFANLLFQLIVPNDHLVWREAAVVGCTDQSEKVAPKQHFHVPNAAALNYPIQLHAERTAVVNSEAC
jgi:hypothetical protein